MDEIYLQQHSKGFNGWNMVKQRVDLLDPSRIYFNERDIWWCHVGKNVGQEQTGKGKDFRRPVLIFKKFSARLCWVIPLSTQIRFGSLFFFVLSESNKIRVASLHQMKLMDVKRFIKKEDIISAEEHKFIKEKITAFIQ